MYVYCYLIGTSKGQLESKIINIDVDFLEGNGHVYMYVPYHLISLSLSLFLSPSLSSPYPLFFSLPPFLPPHSWVCHIDDDIYVNLKQLVKFLSKFNPKKEAIYFGRSGSGWGTPRKVMDGAQYGKPGQKYHFAVGGMYCLSRLILEMSKPYLM